LHTLVFSWSICPSLKKVSRRTNGAVIKGIWIDGAPEEYMAYVIIQLIYVSWLLLSVPTTMNVKLLAASALLVQSGAVLVIYQLFCNCPMSSQPKYAVHQHAAKLFQQLWRHLKGNYDLNSALEKGDR